MGRVVGGERVDRPVGERRAQRLDVTRVSQRRRHLGVRAVARHRLLGEEEMMRRHLGGDREPAGLRVAQQCDRAGRAHVRDVQTAARQVRERDVARHHHLLGGGRDAVQAETQRGHTLVHDPAGGEVPVLLVHDDRQAEHRRVLERPPHETGVHDGTAVVGHGHDARPVHLPDLGEPLALHAGRQRTDRVDARSARHPRPLQDELRHRRAVVHRVGVGHARQRGEAARERGRHAGRDRLFVFVARLAEVHVHVDQTGKHEEPAGIHDRVALGAACPRTEHAHELVVLDQHVAGRCRAGDRVDDRAAGDHDPLAHARPPVRRRTGSASPIISAAVSPDSSPLLRATSR